MYITAVRLYCFRSYTELRFEPAKGLNVIVGANAAGKTNILESVFLAALGRSHRTRRDAELINSLSDKAYAGIELVSATGKHSIELKLFSGAPKQVFIDGQRIRRMGELMGVLNAVMFSPEDLSLVKDSLPKPAAALWTWSFASFDLHIFTVCSNIMPPSSSAPRF